MLRIARFLPFGILLLAVGVCLLVLALAFEHYGMARIQLVLGDLAMAAIVIGSVGAFLAALARLAPGGDADD